jgi:DGQHR domain-containing protein|tara:strand:+ start:750 stop:1865 length:1116 start_codon:yes stop_codon:yes gene_type:complete
MVDNRIKIRALRTIQRGDTPVYAFFIPGELITQIADISRIARDSDDELEGFQRKNIQQHVNNIAAYLDQEDILFPNSILLALSPQVEFTQSRGRDVEGTIPSSQIGTLAVPIREEGNRVAWIVDGQQRSLALSKAKKKGLNVPVIAFEAADLETQREQFILVNKARPLPPRLINELLPEVDKYLPRDLAVRKIPSELCGLLNRDPDSPFYQLIKRISNDGDKQAVIVDSAVIEMIQNSIRNPLGALAQFKSLGTEASDLDKMYETLVIFWNTVKTTFPHAWGISPARSRLMHSAGITSMGILMDRIMGRAMGQPDPEKYINDALQRIAPFCHWTEGTWPHIDLAWNEIQKLSKHVRLLSDLLTRLDYECKL